MTRVILHVGQHKTGTSSIQAFLHANREQLDRAGIFVPTSGMGHSGDHRSLVASFLGEAPPDPQQELARELAREGPERAILSAEFATDGILSGRGDNIVDGLKAAGATKVEILLYLRSPFALANSTYSQRKGNLVREGSTFEEHVAQLVGTPYFHYHHFLTLAGRPDVALTVRPYSRAARRSIVGDFLEALGVRPNGLSEEPRLNVAFGPVALEAMRVLRTETGAIPRRERHALKNRLAKVAHELGEKPFWGIDGKAEEALAPADERTNSFSLAVWGKPWRDVLGYEQRALNRFDPDDRAQSEQFHRVLSRMRMAAAEVLGSAT